MDLYELIVKEIRDIKFENLVQEHMRTMQIDKITEKVTRLVERPPFKILKGYLQESRKETFKLFKVTVYCFIAEKCNFNIN